ncbi:MAG: NnrS family protein [Marinobacter sp.]|uniref:NnrS family protein n=2 Tax=Marinobacter sp. TaxID=50741 RepID=UPI00329692B7
MPWQKTVHAFIYFFPAAALYAAAIVPLTLLVSFGKTGWFPGAAGTGHGHELIFGFVLALMAGYTLGPQPRRKLLGLLALWLLARLLWLMAPDFLLSQLASPAFALILAWLVVPRFNAAKKWRNRITGPLILMICLIPLAWLILTQLAPHLPLQVPIQQTELMHFGILALLLLMTFMGGRLIAPAAAGTLEKKGIPLEARVQPRIEAALIVLLLISAVLYLHPGTRPGAAIMLMFAAILLAIRCLRWQLWRCPERPDLLCLGFGYLWLAIGAAAVSWHLLQGRPPAASLHLITIGALGTLSSGIMLRLLFQRYQRTPPPAWACLLLVTLFAIAAVLRFASGAAPFGHPVQLWLSGLGWSAAYILVAVMFWRHPLTNRSPNR